MYLNVFECLKYLEDESGGGDHGEASVLHLGQLHLLELGRVLAQAKGVCVASEKRRGQGGQGL